MARIRKPKLTNEQVWMLRNDVKNQGVKEYAAEFGVSLPTAYAAKRGKAPYDRVVFTRDFENIMQEKYFAAAHVVAA